MKYINFKRYKFSTIFKNINFRRYNFFSIFKNIDFKRYNFSKIYKYININKYIDIRRYNFSKIYKYIDIRRYNFSKIYKYIDIRNYNFSKIYKNIDFKNYKYIPAYLAAFTIFITLIYLNIPMFFTYDKSKIENIVCKELNIKCAIQGKIKYSFFPSPRIKFSDFIIKDFVDESTILGKIKNAEIMISTLNLYDKRKLNYTKIKFQNVEINFNLKRLKEYSNFFTKKFSSKPINLAKGKINFFEDKKNIATIEDINFKYNSTKSIDLAVLKGGFLGDRVYISLENKKNNNKQSKILIFKLLESKLLAKVDIPNSSSEKEIVDANILFKKGKNRLTGICDYKDGQIIIKKANLTNFFTDGELKGSIKFLPYFNFNLNVDLKRINFTRLHDFVVELNEENKKNLFKINNKINGQLNLSADDIYSKHTLIDSFESRLRFVNGDILFEQFILNLGKLGAADLTGIINNEKKFTNFKFENNIFLDNLKRFYSKFGIHNKKNIPFNLFTSGNFDLVNLNVRLEEISDEQKFKDADVNYIEKEFNNIVLEDGYASLFNFRKLKEFIKTVSSE